MGCRWAIRWSNGSRAWCSRTSRRSIVAAETGDAISVQQFFMYPCPPCFAFEDELVRWEARAADGVVLARVPAMFHAGARLHALAFYAAEALGKLEEMHAAFYDEIHVRGNPLASRAALAELFARFGVDAAAFDAAFDSGEVAARMRQAAALAEDYGVNVTPAFVVAGRYLTTPGLARGDVLAVVDELVALEAERRAQERPAAR